MDSIADSPSKSNTQVDITEYAKRYHAIGFNVSPVDHEKKPPIIRAGDDARYPWGAWKRQRQTVTDLDSMPWDKAAGVMGICGPSGYRCVDFDDVTDPWLITTCLNALHLPNTYKWVVKTPGKIKEDGSRNPGFHIWVHCPDLKTDKGKIDLPATFGADHIELRAYDHYTVLPGSAHPDGGIYQFANGDPTDAPATVGADRVLTAYKMVTIQPAPKPAPQAQPQRASHVGGSGSGHNPAFVNGAISKELDELAATKSGRNNQLNTSAHKLGGYLWTNVVTESELTEMLYQAAVANGYVAKRGEAQARATIRSGITSGKAKPRHVDDPKTPDLGGVNQMAQDAADKAKAQAAQAQQVNVNGNGPAAAQQAAGSIPRIQVNNRQLNHVLNDATSALQRINSLRPTAPVAYTHGGQLSRVLPSSKTVQPITQSGLTGIFAGIADWVTIKADKDPSKPPIVSNVFPPKDMIASFLGLGEWPTLPELTGVINAPSYVGNGHWVESPGYDPVSGLYLVDDVQIGDTTPTAQRIEWAKHQILVELLGDFPFKDDASRAHAVALTLLPFVRHLIPGVTPLHLADAPTAGTGKGLFISACCYPSLGGEVPSMVAGHDEGEWRKRLTASLQSGRSHTNIDNITGKLDSGSLAAALTQSVWADRELGLSRMIQLPIRTIWTATANNVQPDTDIVRRCIWIRLDSNMERPQERTGFRHPKLLSWAEEHRGDLVTAAMTLINNWIAQGEPIGNYVKGSYQSWAETMGGILDAAGIAGFLKNERELSDTAVNESQLWNAFVAAWADKHNGMTVTVKKDLFPIASHYDPSIMGGAASGLGLLDDLLGSGNERSRQTRLGIQLGRMADRVIGEWKIKRGGRSVDGQEWKLERVSLNP